SIAPLPLRVKGSIPQRANPQTHEKTPRRRI
ncbi:MAG: hypothetical protein ACI8V5_004369, partial [Limisphaerales bacterium]